MSEAPQCARRTAVLHNSMTILVRCEKPATHTINITKTPVQGDDFIFPVAVCGSCVQQLTGWH